MQQKELYGEISAFIGRLRDDPSREGITNMQGAIDYLLEKLHIVTEKLQEATGRKEIVLDDKDRRRLASRAIFIFLRKVSLPYLPQPRRRML